MGSCRKNIRRPIVTPKDRRLFCTEEGRSLLHALTVLYGEPYDESKDKIEKELLDKIDNLRGK